MDIINSDLYYSKFAKDQLFDIASLPPIANDTPVPQGKISFLNIQIHYIYKQGMQLYNYHYTILYKGVKMVCLKFKNFLCCAWSCKST